MKSVIVTGAAGRMGQSVIEVLNAQTDSLQVHAVDNKEVSGASTQGCLQDSGESEMVIDFSSPRFLRDICKYCEINKLPLVSGTTGIGSTEQKMLDALAEVAPVLWAANMSFGIALVKKMLVSLARMPDADFYIDDVHHRHKVDAPSGTAKILQQELGQSLAKGFKVTVNSHRAGGVYGDHVVNAATEEELISIKHSALNRLVFAKGAVTSANWLIGKPPGRYNIEDVLGI